MLKHRRWKCVAGRRHRVDDGSSRIRIKPRFKCGGGGGFEPPSTLAGAVLFTGTDCQLATFTGRVVLTKGFARLVQRLHTRIRWRKSLASGTNSPLRPRSLAHLRSLFRVVPDVPMESAGWCAASAGSACEGLCRGQVGQGAGPGPPAPGERERARLPAHHRVGRDDANRPAPVAPEP